MMLLNDREGRLDEREEEINKQQQEPKKLKTLISIYYLLTTEKISLFSKNLNFTKNWAPLKNTDYLLWNQKIKNRLGLEP